MNKYVFFKSHESILNFANALYFVDYKIEGYYTNHNVCKPKITLVTQYIKIKNPVTHCHPKLWSWANFTVVTVNTDNVIAQ